MRLPRLPIGYSLERGRRGWLAKADAWFEALAAAGFGADGDARAIPDSDLAGRRPLGEIASARGRALVRHFVHGGLLRWATGRRFASAARPFEELVLAAALRERGVRTPAVVAARAVRAGRLPGWHLSLVTERVEGARDLATLFEQARQGEVPQGLRADLARELGSALSEWHELGLEHVDLQLRNLLVDLDAPPGERLWLIDLDRSRFGDALARRARERNLERLLRSALRRDRRGAPVLTSSDLARVLRSYAGDRDWRGWARRLSRRSARGAWRHRLGWWLERRAGADPARRDGTAAVAAQPSTRMARRG
jgi:tRNA A-37 threonylcarbamoyl transferase component Bud32